jgi:hypothetical protein
MLWGSGKELASFSTVCLAKKCPKSLGGHVELRRYKARLSPGVHAQTNQVPLKATKVRYGKCPQSVPTEL